MDFSLRVFEGNLPPIRPTLLNRYSFGGTLTNLYSKPLLVTVYEVSIITCKLYLGKIVSKCLQH